MLLPSRHDPGRIRDTCNVQEGRPWDSRDRPFCPYCPTPCLGPVETVDLCHVRRGFGKVEGRVMED